MEIVDSGELSWPHQNQEVQTLSCCDQSAAICGQNEHNKLLFWSDFWEEPVRENVNCSGWRRRGYLVRNPRSTKNFSMQRVLIIKGGWGNLILGKWKYDDGEVPFINLELRIRGKCKTTQLQYWVEVLQSRKWLKKRLCWAADVDATRVLQLRHFFLNNLKISLYFMGLSLPARWKCEIQVQEDLPSSGFASSTSKSGQLIIRIYINLWLSPVKCVHFDEKQRRRGIASCHVCTSVGLTMPICNRFCIRLDSSGLFPSQPFLSNKKKEHGSSDLPGWNSRCSAMFVQFHG